MKTIRTISALVLFVGIAITPAWSEHIGLKFSLTTNSINGDDINPWIASFNSLWQDWQATLGGQLDGEFLPLGYGASYELEIRIPLFKGLALNLGGSRLSAREEGSIQFQSSDGSQTETQSLSNEVTALPLKVGFSYAFKVPGLQRLQLLGGLGRQIIFVRYKVENSYQGKFVLFDREFERFFEKNNTFNSEALGFYATLGAEYDVIDFLAVVLEGEKSWGARVDGFKGSHSYKGILNDEFDEGGDASLYFYESFQPILNQYYTVLGGEKDRPEGDMVRNVRQGELNFNNFSIKIGIRFKF